MGREPLRCPRKRNACTPVMRDLSLCTTLWRTSSVFARAAVHRPRRLTASLMSGSRCRRGNCSTCRRRRRACTHLRDEQLRRAMRCRSSIPVSMSAVGIVVGQPFECDGIPRAVAGIVTLSGRGYVVARAWSGDVPPPRGSKPWRRPDRALDLHSPEFQRGERTAPRLCRLCALPPSRQPEVQRCTNSCACNASGMTFP